jgi:hypothetical protein
VRDSWACEAPNHEGSRTDVHLLDRYTRRQLFMRADGKRRLEEKSLDRICRYCISKELAGVEQPTLEGIA